MSAQSMQDAIRQDVTGIFDREFGVASSDPEAVRAYATLLPAVVKYVIRRLQDGCNCTGLPPF